MKPKPKRPAESSQPAALTKRSVADIKNYSKSPAARAISHALRARRPEPTKADLAAIPALTHTQLKELYRPLKKPVTVRIDADILAWLHAKPGAYQTHLNATLRLAMLNEVTAKNR